MFDLLDTHRHVMAIGLKHIPHLKEHHPISKGVIFNLAPQRYPQKIVASLYQANSLQMVCYILVRMDFTVMYLLLSLRCPDGQEPYGLCHAGNGKIRIALQNTVNMYSFMSHETMSCFCSSLCIGLEKKTCIRSTVIYYVSQAM